MIMIGTKHPCVVLFWSLTGVFFRNVVDRFRPETVLLYNIWVPTGVCFQNHFEKHFFSKLFWKTTSISKLFWKKTVFKIILKNDKGGCIKPRRWRSNLTILLCSWLCFLRRHGGILASCGTLPHADALNTHQIWWVFGSIAGLCLTRMHWTSVKVDGCSAQLCPAASPPDLENNKAPGPSKSPVVYIHWRNNYLCMYVCMYIQMYMYVYTCVYMFELWCKWCRQGVSITAC